MPHPTESVAANRSEFIRKVVNDYLTHLKKPREIERKEKPANLNVKGGITQTR